MRNITPLTTRIGLWAFLLVAALSVPSARAQVEVSSSVYYGSPYVFRGAVFSSGFVFQPTLTLSYGNFYAGFFGNIDPAVGISGNKVGLNEADLFAGYGTTFGALSAAVTYTYYTFPVPDGDEIELSPTQEVALSLSLDAPLSPFAYLVYDFDGDKDAGDLKGFYGEVGVSRPFMLGEQPVDFTAFLAADGGYLLEAGAFELAHATLRLSTEFEAGPVTITPNLSLQVGLSDAYRTAFAKPTLFYGGFTIGF